MRMRPSDGRAVLGGGALRVLPNNSRRECKEIEESRD